LLTAILSEEPTTSVEDFGRNGLAHVRIGERDFEDAEELVVSGRLASFEPVRPLHQGTRSKNRIGLVVVPDEDSTRSVWAESKLEKTHIINQLWAYSPQAIATQPLTLEWELTPGTSLRHTPDFLIEYTDGRRCLFDVRHIEMWNQRFAVHALLTEAWCQSREIEYWVLAAMPDQRKTNLLNLHQVSDLDHSGREMSLRLLSALSNPHSLSYVARAHGGFSSVVAPLRHLMWRRQLVFDIDAPVRSSTWVVSGETDPKCDSFSFHADHVRLVVLEREE